MVTKGVNRLKRYLAILGVTLINTWGLCSASQETQFSKNCQLRGSAFYNNILLNERNLLRMQK